MVLIEQTIGAASANANNRNDLGSHRSDCSEAAQPMRAEIEAVSVVPMSWVIRDRRFPPIATDLRGAAKCRDVPHPDMRLGEPDGAYLRSLAPAFRNCSIRCHASAPASASILGGPPCAYTRPLKPSALKPMMRVVPVRSAIE
jgi:hypothetical protein